LKDNNPSENGDVLTIEPIGSYDTKGTRLTCVTVAEDLPDSAKHSKILDFTKEDDELDLDPEPSSDGV